MQPAISQQPAVTESVGLPAKHEVVRPAPQEHIGALDGVRGLAILLVLAHHIAGSVQYEFKWTSPLWGALHFGWVGVDLFFVLSGFLITGILFDAKGQEKYFANFYARRTLRIFPLYYAALVVLLGVGAVWPSADFYPVQSQGWLWVYATNIVISLKGFGAFGIFDHFWSLAIEEQFYLVWPFVVFSFGHRKLIWIALGLFAAAFFVRCGLIVGLHKNAAAYVFTPARMDALAAGAFVALVSRLPEGKEALQKYARPVLAASALVLVGVLAWRRTSNHDDTVIATVGCSALAALFAAGIVLIRSFPRLERVLNFQGFRFFGKYSYGIYVWHPMIFIMVLHTEAARALRGGNQVLPALLAIAIGIVGTALMTALSWNALEKQCLKLKKHFH